MGWIASWYICDLFHANKRTDKNIKHTIATVASRSVEKAQELLDKEAPGIMPKIFTSYQELICDPDIDVIYVATPHGLHYEHLKLCLEGGKNVLREKAFTINARQAKELAALAKAKNLYLMEGRRNQKCADVEVLTLNSNVDSIPAYRK